MPFFHDPRRFCLVLLVTLVWAVQAHAQTVPIDRVREVVSAAHQYYLEPVPATAYAQALRAAQGAAGEPASPAGNFDSAMATLLSRHPKQADHIATAAIRGFTEGIGDPYTTWLSAEDKATLDAQQGGQSFSGIGVEVAPDPAGLRVVASLEGSPARRAGLRPGDRIQAIDGKALKGLGLYRASDLLVGPVGSAVTLAISRANAAPTAVKVQRATLHMPPVQGKLLDGRVGYVHVAIFGPQTADQARSAIVDLAHQGARAWIVDLRDNPGGTLKSAVELAGIFAPGQTIVKVMQRGGGEEARAAPGTPGRATAPVAILINRGTASSSEVLAGALSDLHVAVLIGERSFGKGLIQTMVPLRGGGALRVTTARYRTPAGHDIHGRGLTPDIACPTDGNAAIQRALSWIKSKTK